MEKPDTNFLSIAIKRSAFHSSSNGGVDVTCYDWTYQGHGELMTVQFVTQDIQPSSGINP